MTYPSYLSEQQLRRLYDEELDFFRQRYLRIRQARDVEPAPPLTVVEGEPRVDETDEVAA